MGWALHWGPWLFLRDCVGASAGQSLFNMLGYLRFRPLRDHAESSQAFLMAASTCHPESTEPLIQVCQVRGVP